VLVREQVGAQPLAKSASTAGVVTVMAASLAQPIRAVAVFVVLQRPQEEWPRSRRERCRGRSGIGHPVAEQEFHQSSGGVRGGAGKSRR
jgi:hypothetical protein